VYSRKENIPGTKISNRGIFWKGRFQTGGYLEKRTSQKGDNPERRYSEWRMF
jgi:hypothetical protein